MSITTSKSRIFEDHSIPTADNNSLCAVTMRPKPSTPAQRVVMISPLAGAGAGSQLKVFRDFARRGAIMICYEYRGHPRSTGTFDLDGTVADTHHALVWALDYARELGLPLHGFGTCYGAITLLEQFKPGGCGPCLRSVATASGLYHLHQIMSIEDFTPIVARHLGRDLDTEALVEGIEQGTVDCDGLPLRKALREYLTSLMPELRIELDSFEELRYDRIDMRGMLLQFARANYLEGVKVPPSVPATAVFGTGDWLLKADTAEGRERYRNRVAEVIPHAVVHELDMDHYANGPDHERFVKCIGDSFERTDLHAVPPPHVNVPRYRSVPR